MSYICFTMKTSGMRPPGCSTNCLENNKDYVRKSNDLNQFAYKKARSTLDIVGLQTHTIAKSLGGGSNVQKAVLWI